MDQDTTWLNKNAGELKALIAEARKQAGMEIVQRLLVIYELRLGIHEINHHGKEGDANVLANGIAGALEIMEKRISELFSV